MSLPSRRAWSFLRGVASAALAGSVVGLALVAVVTLPVLGAWADGPQRWQGHFGVQARPTSDRMIGEGQIFMPVWQNQDSLLFLDLRGVGDSDDNTEGQFGMGFRKLFSDEWIGGGYGFFDYRSSGRTDNTFVSGVIGLEALSTNWDIRGNGYLPDDEEKSASGESGAKVENGSLVILDGKETALFGFDSEVGWRIPFADDSIFWDTRIYAGGFWFDAPSGFGSDIAGPRGRMEMRFHDVPLLPAGSRITLGGQVQHDESRGLEGGGSLTLRVPFYGFGGSPPDGSTANSRLARRMTDPIVRDIDIQVKVGQKGSNAAFNPKNNQQTGPVVFVSSTGDGDGSSSSNPASLPEGIDLAGENGVVIVLDEIDVADSPTYADLEPGQYLLSGGAQAFVQNQSGKMFSFTAPGTQGTLFREDTSDPVIIASQNNTIAGLDIFGGNFGILADDPRQLMVMDSNFEGFGSAAINIGFEGGSAAGFDVMSSNNRFIGSGDGKAIVVGSPGSGTGRLWSQGDHFQDVEVGIFAGVFAGISESFAANLEVSVHDALFQDMSSAAALGYVIAEGDVGDVAPIAPSANLAFHVYDSTVTGSPAGFFFAGSGDAFDVGDVGDVGQNRNVSLEVGVENSNIEAGLGLAVVASGFDLVDVHVSNSTFTRPEGEEVEFFGDVAAIQIGGADSLGGDGKGDAKMRDGNRLRFYAENNTINGYLTAVEVSARFVDNVEIDFKHNTATAGEEPDPFDFGFLTVVSSVGNLQYNAYHNELTGFGSGIGLGGITDVGDVGLEPFGVANATVSMTENTIAGDGKRAIDVFFDTSGGGDFQVHDNDTSGYDVGFDFFWGGVGGVVLALTGNQFEGVEGDVAAKIEIEDVEFGLVDVNASNNTIDGFYNGINIISSTGSGVDNRFAVNSNRMVGMVEGGTAIRVSAETSDTDVDLEIFTNDNDIASFGTGILQEIDTDDATIEVEANRNTIEQTAGTALEIENNGDSDLDAEVEGNAIDGADTGIDLDGDGSDIDLPSPDCTVAANDNAVSNTDTDFTSSGVSGTICVNGEDRPTF